MRKKLSDVTYTTNEIAAKCGVTTRAVTKYASALGFSKKAGRWEFSEEEAASILEHYGTKQNQKEPSGTERNLKEPETEQVPNGTEPNGTERNQGSEMKLALDILQKQLEEKDKTIQQLLDLVSNQSSGYVAEKTAESLERGRAALAIEEEKEEQPRKITFGQRLKFLFTGEFPDGKIDI